MKETATMANDQLLRAKRCYKVGLWGTVVVAICCFTPLLVIAVGSIGLAAVIPYLDSVLFPLLGIFIILAVYGWWSVKKCREES